MKRVGAIRQLASKNACSPDASRRKRMPRRRGFSLLEVILAMAILAGSIAVLGETARLALKNAEFARDMSRAQLLCESKMAEVVCGLTTPDPVDAAPVDTDIDSSQDPDDPGWLYSIQADPLDMQGLLSLRVTVTRNLPPERRPVSYSLTRWIPDPTAQSGQSDAGMLDGGSGTTSLGGGSP